MLSCWSQESIAKQGASELQSPTKYVISLYLKISPQVCLNTEHMHLSAEEKKGLFHLEDLAENVP